MPWLTDRKWAHIRLEGTAFGGVPLNLELKLEVWDSPNSAGIVIDAVRCAKLALDRGIGGALIGPSSYFMKSPPQQFTDAEARERTRAFMAGDGVTVDAVTTRLSRPARARTACVGRVLAGRMPGVRLSERAGRRRSALGRAFRRRAASADPVEPARAMPRDGRADRRRGSALAVEIDAELIEIDCGAWTGASFADLHDDPRWQRWNSERGAAAMPGGRDHGGRAGARHGA